VQSEWAFVFSGASHKKPLGTVHLAVKRALLTFARLSDQILPDGVAFADPAKAHWAEGGRCGRRRLAAAARTPVPAMLTICTSGNIMLNPVRTIPGTPNGNKDVPVAFVARLWFIHGKDLL
jgi:hypothetical protein